MTTLLASEGDWEIRKTPCGKVYFLNHVTGADQWACPEELAAKGACAQTSVHAHVCPLALSDLQLPLHYYMYARTGYTETGPPPCQTGGACINESGSCAPADKVRISGTVLQPSTAKMCYISRTVLSTSLFISCHHFLFSAGT